MMREEHVTKALLKWLIASGWEIICFDFPQSGTGKMLHPNGASGDKNKKAIIPDIVAVRNGICVFFENKDRFYYPDYEKQNSLIVGNEYSVAIASLLAGYPVRMIYYGIGLPESKQRRSSKEAAHLVDFILTVDDKNDVQIAYNPADIEF